MALTRPGAGRREPPAFPFPIILKPAFSSPRRWKGFFQWKYKVLNTNKQTSSQIYLNLLRILQPDPTPATSEDVKKHAVAELFLEWRLSWSVGRVLVLAEWLEREVKAQLFNHGATALRIDYESACMLGDTVGAAVAAKAMALAGIFEVGNDYFYGDPRESPRLIGGGHIPPYRAN